MARPWIDVYSGQHFRITTGVTADATVARVKTYGEIITNTRRTPSPRAATRAADRAPARQPACCPDAMFGLRS